jgi:hypothetical protein
MNLGMAFQALNDSQSAKDCFDRARAIEKRSNSKLRKIVLQFKKRA